MKEEKKQYGGTLKHPHEVRSLAIKNMVRFRYDAKMYVFWRNVYLKAKEAIESAEKTAPAAPAQHEDTGGDAA